MTAQPEEPAPRAPFTSDEPVALDQDAFGHRDYARALAEIARDDHPPLTIGIFGSWGVGKSTIIAGLKEELGDEVAFAYFDAWRYEEDSLRRQFLKDVARDLKEGNHLRLREFDPESDLSELDVDEQRTEEGFSLSWARAKRALAVGAVIAAVAFVLIQIGSVTDFIAEDNFGKRFVPAAAAGIVAFLAGLFSQWIHVTQRVVSVKSLTDPDRFQAKFVDLVKAVCRERLVVTIDNLDRASPGKAVEMLSTIKTYLEPAVKAPTSSRPSVFTRSAAPKHVVFVVAVDDAALRRHLLAQELTRSAASGEGAALRYVDEYLAKFFNVRLPIRPILADDMRAYVGKHLGNLISTRKHKDDETRLISMVSTALRRNPRRIKQFVNDFEARLRLLEEREKTPPGGQPGIAAPVSRDVLVVAKLALIETEWPDAFERLQREPRKLLEWHSAAEQSDAVYVHETPDQPSWEDRERARVFAALLRASSTVSSVHLRALIDLRQAPAEAGIPGFAEFRDAVISGERAEAQRLMEEASDSDKPRFAERLTSVLSDELEHGDFDAARAVVDAVLSVEGISTYEETRSEVLGAALESAHLREQFRQLDPVPLVDAARAIPQAKRDLLHGVLVRRFLDDNESFSSQTRAATALAAVAESLSEGLRRQIRAGIRDEALRDQVSVYAPLAGADPSLLPKESAEPAMAALLPTPDSPQRDLSWEDGQNPAAEAAFTVLLASLKGERHAELENRLFGHIIHSLDRAEADGQMLSRAISRSKALVDATQQADPAEPARVAQHLQQRWTAYPPEQWPALADLLGVLLDQSEESIRGGVASQVISEIFGDPVAGISFVNASQSLPAAFIPAVTDQLSGLLAQPAHRDSALSALVHLAPDDFDSRVSNAVITSVQNNDFEGAISLIDRYPDRLGAHGVEMATHVLNRTQELIDTRVTPPYRVLGRLGGWMDEAQTERLVQLITTQLSTGQAEALETVDALAQSGDGSQILDRVVEAALTSLEGMPHLSPTHFALLDLVVSESERLDAGRIDGLVTRLEVWVNEQPDQRVEISARMGALTNLRPAQRERMVRFLMAAEKGEEAMGVRVELLRAAHRLKGRANSRASGVFERRLQELDRGPEDDQALANQVRDFST